MYRRPEGAADAPPLVREDTGEMRERLTTRLSPKPTTFINDVLRFFDDIDIDNLEVASEETEAAAALLDDELDDEPATLWQKSLDELKLGPGCDRKSFNVVRNRIDDIDIDNLVIAGEETEETAALLNDEPATLWQKCLDELKLGPEYDRNSFNVVRGGSPQVSSNGFYEQAILEQSQADEGEAKNPVTCRSLHDVVRF
eukprot:TRINITY_DN23870_c0_g3_i2.p1 TRINITY_DN23870_c0_g3~~TRINITY_DN23870_c0_g3_i2.p1  ORF type:complete len:199 (+),score=54.49 TRINITY_DN23870_c0_g3_i2:53-649(+)